MLDYACISLSDLLVPWEGICSGWRPWRPPISSSRSTTRRAPGASSRSSRRRRSSASTAPGRRRWASAPRSGPRRSGWRSPTWTRSSSARSACAASWSSATRRRGDPRPDGHPARVPGVILLLGGTSEAGKIAAALRRRGSRCSSRPPRTRARRRRRPGSSRCAPGCSTRRVSALILGPARTAMVDATHPYAAENRRSPRGRNAGGVLSALSAAAVRGGEGRASEPGRPRGRRPARVASGRPVLLTVGTRNLAPYVNEARRTGTR